MKRTLTARDFSLALALAAICCYFALRSPVFLSSRNISLLFIELSVTAVLALGMLLVLLPGQIDLSAGSGVGLFGAIAAVLVFNHDWPAPTAMLTVLVGAPLLWSAMGALIVKQRIPAFIITLGGLLIFKGLHWLVIRAETVPVVAGGETNLYSLLTTYYVKPAAGLLLAAAVVAGIAWQRLRSVKRRRRFGLQVDDFELSFLKLFVTAQVIALLVLLTNQYRGLPLAGLVLGAVAFAVHVLTRHTPFGRYLYAIGGNEEAARLSGVPVDRIVILAFALMGFVVALSGLLLTAYSGASTTTVGNLLELDAIAACVIGGTSLRGGRGSVLGVLFGSLIMATLLNGMTLLAVSPEVKFIARGVVLALAVWLDVRLSRGE